MFIIYEFIFKFIIYVTVCLLFAVVGKSIFALPFFFETVVFSLCILFSLMLLLNLRGHGESKAIQFQFVISSVVSRCYSLLFGLTKGYYIKEIVCSLYWIHL